MQITNTSDSAIYCSFTQDYNNSKFHTFTDKQFNCNQFILARDSCWIKVVVLIWLHQINARQSYVICVGYCKYITDVSILSLLSIRNPLFHTQLRTIITCSTCLQTDYLEHIIGRC
ncbi:Hypothetical_protein [Hexamita inflata]|uniref:Hypothetical_protein n=1 Tax=Hexamita inflata TaxID=28002 RepID=A0AA86PZV1_9EUKA|nr:Hypothetical protein HINF_LOCUS35591 [Hexamita inflata]CAI9947948.1 Hypothetical protein HINF_LOCUS35593 [Hexamita inflata]CAI9947950.1 Hypothetical protein HINF_LOCUS35595 [Hexamita inflata]CAI9970373.1 Hypothetical protein HINF_LOCUS58018 [Hexamita inflata]